MKIKKKSNAIRVPPLKKAIKIKRKSLDIDEESSVSKALHNVKSVLQKKNVKSVKKVVPLKIIKSSNVKETRRKGNIIRKKHPRGVIYLGHIPHGFYEEQMKDYFSQFGKVTRVRVARSKNTGQSRGYGYIEFINPDVAKIAAETMNNYLMCGRLLKATNIPPEKQHKRYFTGISWTKEVYPKAVNRSNVTTLRNTNIDEKQHIHFVQRTKDKLSNLEKKLNDKGFDIKFTLNDNIK